MTQILTSSNPLTFKQGLAPFLKLFFELSVPKSESDRLRFFKFKFYAALLLSAFFWLFDFYRMRYLGPLTPGSLRMGLIPITLQILVLGIPYFLFCVRHWHNHLSKLPALVAAFFSYGLSLTPLIKGIPSPYLPYLQLTSFILLVIAYLFYIDQKNIFDANSQALYLKNLTVFSAKLWIKDGQTQLQDTLTLKPKDKILVLPGEAIARDGIIISGTTSVDESKLTHEQRPLHKGKGDWVFAGTRNRGSEILIEIQGPIQNDILSQMMEKAEAILKENSPLKKRARFLARFYPLFFMLASAGLGFIYVLVKGKTQVEASLAMICVLLASPFCLDSLARITIVRLIGNVFHKGIIVNNASILEKLGAIHTLFFNKTGILTEGQFVYSQDVIQSGNNLGEVLSTVFSLEKEIDHPLSSAMTSHPWYNEISLRPVTHKTFYSGLGITGTLLLSNGEKLEAHVGNLRFMKRQQCQISKELKAELDELEALGETVILCGFDKQVRGLMTFVDILRRNVRATLKEIKSLGIHCALITGDTEKTITQAIGDLHLDQIYSRCTPEEKTQKIEAAQKPWTTVALVTNDIHSESFLKAPLTLSTDSGLHIHKHPADVVIMNSNIQKLSWILRQTRIYRRALRAALWGSSAIGGVTLVVTYFGILQPYLIFTASTLWALLLLENISKLKIKESLR